MKITALICNYNYGQFLEEAILSAITQSYQCDIVVVDDGSTDNSNELLKDIEKNYGITVLHTPNVGPSEARNVGIRASWRTTDAWAILDADDFWHLKKLERCVEYLKDEQIGSVYTNYITIDDKKENAQKEFKEPFSYSKLLQECVVHSGSIIHKRALQFAFKDGYFYDPQMRTCEDYDLWIRIAKRFTIAHVPEFLTMVRVHNNNSTNSVKQEIWQYNWNRIREKEVGLV